MVVNAKEKTDNANKDKGKANICYQKKKFLSILPLR